MYLYEDPNSRFSYVLKDGDLIEIKRGVKKEFIISFLRSAHGDTKKLHLLSGDTEWVIPWSAKMSEEQVLRDVRNEIPTGFRLVLYQDRQRRVLTCLLRKGWRR